MAFSGTSDSGQTIWAELESRRLLEPLGRRWRHTLGVVEQARQISTALGAGEADALVGAAYLHDIGYAPELAETGLHPLDGARFVRASGHERLAGLVAYHSSAVAEAAERGLASELAEFVDECSDVSRALTYCDLTTDPEGNRTTPAARLKDIRDRYGPETAERRAIERAMRWLLEDVRMVEAMPTRTASAPAAAGQGGSL